MRFVDPFGLFKFSVSGYENNRIFLGAIGLIQQMARNAVGKVVVSPEPPTPGLTLIEAAGWATEQEFLDNMRYGTEPEITIEPDFWVKNQKLGYEIAGGIGIAEELLSEAPSCVFSSSVDQEFLMKVLADTIIHELSHWKVRNSGANPWWNDPSYSGQNPIEGWNFLYNLQGGQSYINASGEAKHATIEIKNLFQ